MTRLESFAALSRSYADKALRYIVSNPDLHDELMEQALAWQSYAELELERVVMEDGDT